MVSTIGKIDEFNEYREKMNEVILRNANLNIKRFWNLDSRTYEAGVLSTQIKELLGLVASMVLRCDDCITYHLVQCHKHGVTEEELFEAYSVALIVGGSIIIPHLRRAVEKMPDLYKKK